MFLRIGLASLAALSLTGTASSAIAQTSAGRTLASADDNKVLCKGETRPNSRFKEKVCKTRAEWEQIRVQQQRDAREMFDQPKINSTMGG